MNEKTAGQVLPDIVSLWDYDHPEATEKKFRDLLFAVDSTVNPGYVAELLTQIARTYSLRDQFTQAHETLDQVKHLLSSEHPRAEVRYLLERGRTFNSAGKREQAREPFLQAWELGKSSGEEDLAIDAAHMMAIVEAPAEQLQWNLKAVELAEGAKDEKASNWLGSLYNNIGWSYFDLQQYDRALLHFERALAWRMSQGQAKEIRIAKWCIGRTHRAMGTIGTALEIQQDLFREIEQSGAKQDGYVLEELAECYLALGQPEHREFFALAYQNLSRDRWLVKNEPDRLKRMKELGKQ